MLHLLYNWTFKCWHLQIFLKYISKKSLMIEHGRLCFVCCLSCSIILKYHDYHQFCNFRFGWMEDGNPHQRWRGPGLHHQLPEPEAQHHLLLQSDRLQRARNIRTLHQRWNGKIGSLSTCPRGKFNFLRKITLQFEKIIKLPTEDFFVMKCEVSGK